MVRPNPLEELVRHAHDRPGQPFVALQKVTADRRAPLIVRRGFCLCYRPSMLIPILETISALAAAGFWFWSATIRVYPGQLFGGVSSEQKAKMDLQSRLNAWAAGLTGLTALLQAANTIMAMYFD